MLSLPAEIVEHIIDNFYDDRAQLRSCRLVSVEWATRAEHSLFRKLRLPIRLHMSRDAALASLIPSRISRHTHLLHVVGPSHTPQEHLAAPRTPNHADPNGLATVIGQFPALTGLYLDRQTLDKLSCAEMRGLCPGLRKLRIAHCSGSVSDFAELLTALPPLSHLEFSSTVLTANEDGRHLDFPDTTQLEHLELYTWEGVFNFTPYSESFYSWFFGHPSNVRNLRSMVVADDFSELPLTRGPLQLSTHSLEEMCLLLSFDNALDRQPRNMRFDFSEFTCLHTLTLQCDGPIWDAQELNSIMNRLETVKHATLTELRLFFRNERRRGLVLELTPWDSWDWSRLDTVSTTAPFRNLRRIQIVFGIPAVHVLLSTNSHLTIVSQIETWLPRLVSKGILHVDFVDVSTQLTEQWWSF